MIQRGRKRAQAATRAASLEIVEAKAWLGVNQPTQWICLRGQALVVLLDFPHSTLVTCVISHCSWGVRGKEL